MARIFITGSADGLGHLAANLLVKEGHRVVLHARNAERANEALKKIPAAEKVLIADFSKIEEIKALADEVNALGDFDAVIHNAGVYDQQTSRIGAPNFQQVMFTVNTLAPYILTCLIRTPSRLVYLSSRMHFQGDPGLTHMSMGTNQKNLNYSDTKLHDVILCMAVARKWKNVYANAVDPGWVPTKMGGAGAPDDLEKGYQTQAWLAVSNDPEAKVSGRYFYHQRQKSCLPAANDVNVQDKFLSLCEQFSGVRFPA